MSARKQRQTNAKESCWKIIILTTSAHLPNCALFSVNCSAHTLSINDAVKLSLNIPSLRGRVDRRVVRKSKLKVKSTNLRREDSSALTTLGALTGGNILISLSTFLLLRFWIMFFFSFDHYEFFLHLHIETFLSFCLLISSTEICLKGLLLGIVRMQIKLDSRKIREHLSGDGALNLLLSSIKYKIFSLTLD